MKLNNDDIQIIKKLFKHINNVSTNYNFKYSLMYGTLIGYMRHGGIIPWDDDVYIVTSVNNRHIIKQWFTNHPYIGLYHHKEFYKIYMKNGIIKKKNRLYLKYIITVFPYYFFYPVNWVDDKTQKNNQRITKPV